MDPQAVKTRVLTHMTKDHADSLALYLQHYCRIPASQAPINPPLPVGTIKLEDLTLEHMIISHPGGRNIVPINPPMKSMAESRERLITMHKDCLRGLGLADFRVEQFVGPNQAWQWGLHFLTLMSVITLGFWPASAFMPESGQFPYQFWSFGGLTPWFAILGGYIKNYVLTFIFVAHTGETVWFSRTRLRKYWVQRFSGLWWKWTGIVFLGGVAGITRFDSHVESLERERNAKAVGKH